MISETTELVLKGEEKEKYTKNIVHAIEKINKYYLKIYDVKKLENLINFYNIDTELNAKRFDSLEIDSNTGFPTKQSIEILFKDRNIYQNNKENNIVEKIKEALKNNSDIKNIRDEYAQGRYFEEIKKSDIIDGFYSTTLKDDSLAISSYINNCFSISTINFKPDMHQNITEFYNYLEDKNENDKPNYLETIYQKLQSYELIPESIEKQTIGPFYRKRTGNENYQVRTAIKDDDSYVLQCKKEKLSIQTKKSIKWDFLVPKKSLIIDKEFCNPFVVYCCSSNLYLNLLDILPNDVNVKVI
jgi:hypothetical protein